MGNDLQHLTAAEVCELCGIADRTLRDWTKSGLPRNQDRSFSGPAVVAWRLAKAIREASPDAEAARTQVLRIRGAEIVERVKKARRENAEAEGDLISAAEVEASNVAKFTAAKLSFQSLPDELGQRFGHAPQENAEWLRDRIAEIVGKIAQGDSTFPVNHERIHAAVLKAMEELKNDFRCNRTPSLGNLPAGAPADSSANAGELEEHRGL